MNYVRVFLLMTDSDPPHLIDIDNPYPPAYAPYVLGQDRAVNNFLKAMQSGHGGNVWMFNGPKGVGKMTLAYRLARAILHNGSPYALTDGDTPPACQTNMLINAKAHPDLHVVQPLYDTKTEKFAQLIRVDAIQDVHQFCHLSAGLGGWRVCIIDSLDDMNVNGHNALLKLIEEPPAQVMIFLIVHNRGWVPDTVGSRCLRLDFTKLTPPDIETIIQYHLPAADAQARKAGANLAAGNAHKALALVGENGLALYQEMLTHIGRAQNPDSKKLHELATRLSASGAQAQFSLFAGLLQDWLARLIKARIRGEGVDIFFEEESRIISQFAAHAPAMQLLDLWQKIGDMARQTEHLNLDRKQTILEWFSLYADIATQGS